MRELSLFTGGAGGALGTKLLGWQHRGYVEFNNYCQQIIRQRIKDGFLDEAPIFSDIRTFISDGYADSYQDLVDVVSAGFPCQPFSVAGKGEAENDPRNMWPETIDVIRRVRPKFAWLENVSNLITHEYIRTVFRDLAESGYESRWCVLSAGKLGASHLRERLWILSSNTECNTVQRWEVKTAERNKNPGKEQLSGLVQSGTWPTLPECKNVGADYGVAHRVDRLKAIGNGQVPAVVVAAWKLLSQDLIL